MRCRCSKRCPSRFSFLGCEKLNYKKSLPSGHFLPQTSVVKKRLNLDASLYTLLQILPVTLFEKMPLEQAFPCSDSSSNSTIVSNQLNLFAL